MSSISFKLLTNTANIFPSFMETECCIDLPLNFKILIENGDKENLSAEMKKINGIKEILNGIK